MLKSITALIAMLVFTAEATVASCAETAFLEIIGYSTDQKYFAFEEYGTEDASTYPYSNIFIVDIAGNGFVEGTPVRVRLQSEYLENDDSYPAMIAHARKISHEKVSAVIDRLGFAKHPGYMLVFNPASELKSDPLNVAFSTPPSRPTFNSYPNRKLALKLEKFKIPPPEWCQDYTGHPAIFGFKLTLQEPGKRSFLIHEDKNLPQSRDCPTDYRIGAVIADQGSIVMTVQDSPVLIAMIEVNSLSSEGDYIRWLAVPLKR